MEVEIEGKYECNGEDGPDLLWIRIGDETRQEGTLTLVVLVWSEGFERSCDQDVRSPKEITDSFLVSWDIQIQRQKVND